MESLAKNGEKAFKAGKKDLKTSVFKWKPDYDSAASNFEEAAKLFKSAKEWQRTVETYEQVVFCNKKIDDAWGIARGLEGMIDTYIDHPEIIKNQQHLIDLMKEATVYFRAEDGFTNLLRLHKKMSTYLVKQGNIEQAIQLAKEGYQEAILSDKKYNMGDIMNYYIEILVQNEQYAEAISVYKTRIDTLKNVETKVPLEQFALMIVCLCLISNEPIRADNMIQELQNDIKGFMKTTEYVCCYRMLEHFQNGEQQDFDKMVNRPPITLQYPPIIPRLIRKVKTNQIIVNNNQNNHNNNNEFLQELGQQQQQQQSQDTTEKVENTLEAMCL